MRQFILVTLCGLFSIIAVQANAQAQHGQTLNWSETATVAGYNVSRGTAAGGPYTKLNSALIIPKTYFDSTGTAGTKYFYVVTAVDSLGVESLFSNEVSGTAIGPPPPPSLSITSAMLITNPDGTETALVKFTDAPNQDEVVLFYNDNHKLIGQRIVGGSSVTSFAQEVTEIAAGTPISVTVCSALCVSAQAM